MKFIRNISSFPLLTKELSEQANKKRTYIIRLFLVCGLFAYFGFRLHKYFQDAYTVRAGWGIPRSLGALLGRDYSFIILELMAILLVTTMLILPGVMGGVLTREKENRSLDMLLITGLSPWTILLEKYFSRILPLVFFQVLLLPVAAVIYTFGGLSISRLITANVSFLCFTLFIGAWCLFCSAYFKKTAVAVIAAYFISGGVFIYYLDQIGRNVFGHIQYRDSTHFIVKMLIYTALLLIVCKRLMVNSGEQLEKIDWHRVLANIDAYIKDLNKVYAGGFMVFKDRSSLYPADEPVAWRELRRLHLAKTRDFVRQYVVYTVLIIVFFLVSILLFLVSTSSYVNLGEYLLAQNVFWLFWVYFTFLLVLTSVSIVNREYRCRTMDVLLTTPIDGSEIITQKLKASNRVFFLMLLTMLMPFVVSILFYPKKFVGGHVESFFLHLVHLLSLICSTWFFWNFAIWLGLTVKKSSVAILIAIFTMLFFLFIPSFYLYFFGLVFRSHAPVALTVMPFSRLDTVPMLLDRLFRLRGYYYYFDFRFFMQRYRQDYLWYRFISITAYFLASSLFFTLWQLKIRRSLSRS